MKVLDAVARILKAEGIEWAGCFPSNNLIEAVAEVGINPITVSYTHLTLPTILLV